MCDFLGRGQVYCTSDMFWNGLDDENPWSGLPPKMGDNDLIAPDYVRYPKFMDVRPYASIVDELKEDEGD